MRVRVAAVLAGALAFVPVRGGGQGGGSPFLVKPYVQLGDAPYLADAERLDLLWHAARAEADWTVETRAAAGGAGWIGRPVAARRVSASPPAPHFVYRATLSGLRPGAPFSYRVRKGGAVVFQSQSRARKAFGQPFRVVLFGDCAENSRGQKAVAFQTHRLAPDFVFVTGDIVYPRGRISEYRASYFPVYNAEQAAPTVGAPLLRSVPFLAAPGNHDLQYGNLARWPDLFAYFYYWAQPLNGPLAAPGERGAPLLSGPLARKQAVADSGGANYPRMASFAFDYGSAHWTVLDSNIYADWTKGRLRDWLERDLASVAARRATWRFVAFHHAPFHSSKQHRDNTWMRALDPVLRKHGVDVVFSGHVHNYQRTFPLAFTPGKRRGYHVDGDLRLDKNYDGAARTRPDGLIYVVTGAGGGPLYDAKRAARSADWQPFTARYEGVYSLTCADANGRTLTVRQISGDGRELDRFVVTK